MKQEGAEAYPLAWPQGWPRTSPGQRQGAGRFKTGTRNYTQTGSYMSMRPVTPDYARKQLCEELDRMKAKNVVISSNVQIRADGQMSAASAARRHDDPGIAVYFTLKGKQLVMAQDAYDRVEGNLRSLGLAIEALRQLERHGGGTMMERAFAGFSALPPPEGYTAPARPWREVMGYNSTDPGATEDLSWEEVQARYKTLAKKYHPDNQGGDGSAMSALNVARDQAQQEFGE